MNIPHFSAKSPAQLLSFTTDDSMTRQNRKANMDNANMSIQRLTVLMGIYSFLKMKIVF